MNSSDYIVVLLADQIEPALPGSVYMDLYAEATPATFDNLFEDIAWSLWDVLDAEELFKGVSDTPIEHMLLWDDAVALAFYRVCNTE